MLRVQTTVQGVVKRGCRHPVVYCCRSAGMSRSRDRCCLSVVAAVLQFINRTIGSLLSPSSPTVFCSTVAVIDSKIAAYSCYWETAVCVAGHMWSDRGCCEYWGLQ